MLDPIKLSQDLIACPSVTPNDAGCMNIIGDALIDLGFQISRVRFGDVDNLYAKLNSHGKNFCFAGHTDVVPIGDRDDWAVDPFASVVIDDRLIGRGAADMKCAIACYLSALSQLVESGPVNNTFSVLLTSDEEGAAINGIQKMIPWLKEKQETIDACLIGEPTNPDSVGQMAKVGRRGSLTAHITVKGSMGHVAYPDESHNPIHPLSDFLSALYSHEWDKGTEDFLPSSLQITTVDVGNHATNVIPQTAKASFNIRFNILQTAVGLKQNIEKIASRFINIPFELKFHHSGDPFLGADKYLRNILGEAVAEICGASPAFTTTGGTSDGRFIKDICPVIEFGMNSNEAHKVNESVSIDDIHKLTAIYTLLLQNIK